jgi:uncharacterized protein (DUF1800 family)
MDMKSFAGVAFLCLGSALVLTELSVSAQLPDLTPTRADTVRFLEQATFGPNPELIATVRAQGFEAYLAQQREAGMAPYPTYPDLPHMPTTRPEDCTGPCQQHNYTMHPLQVHFFENAIEGEDQLRQRVAWALSQILVVSGLDITLSSWMSPYQQLLYSNAFGNYGHLVYLVTRNAAMGRYLDTAGNRCQTRTPPDVSVCRLGSPEKPNENYARELLQLFTIGTDLLNSDGTPVVDADGAPIPSYDQGTVEEFARVLTGWILEEAFPEGPNYIDPMRHNEARHDRGPKTLLTTECGPDGTDLCPNAQLPGGQTADEELRAAMTNIMAHRNVAPFISRQLIQHFVTSNPTPGYVADIAAVFASSADSRLQLFEVVRAILLHPEARGGFRVGAATAKLREPVQFVTNVLRALNASTDGVLNSIVVADADNPPIGSAQMSQNVFNAPSVFSFYSPNHVIPRTDPPLFGPQFQIHSTSTAIRRANFVNQVVFGAIPGTTIHPPARWLALASFPDELISGLDMLFLHGTMSAEMRALIREAIIAAPPSDAGARVQQALYLIATSNQYQVQR